ncbi:MAG: crotonase/enoyl-CoA hydratase family protein [Pseudomonadales bacterium]|nr:crotonase/enoyl-CoA hydratase family protein [Pseudomonadales bacterium]NIX08877.1 crotonase/enoyl-CoA hydratase family protein [Pseudomonadales bacterium]
MSEFLIENDVALLRLEAGKANAVSHDLLDSIDAALDEAAAAAKALVITGRDGMFSAGFDLQEIGKGQEAALTLVNRGGAMLNRLFTHPQPVVAACTGHAIAAGAFMLLASDTRIGAEGPFRIGLNETAIGMALPVFGLELAKARLSQRHMTASVIQARIYSPETAVDAGFLDETRPAEQVLDAALSLAAELGALPSHAYAANKLGMRNAFAEAIRKSLA